MVAPWDRRSPSEQRRVQSLLLGTWLPQAVSYAPHWTAVAERLGLDPESLDGRDELAGLPPSRQADVAGSGGPGAPGIVMRPTEAQVKARSDTSTLVTIAQAIRSEGAGGKRRRILEEFKPLHIQRGGIHDQLAIAASRSDLDRMHRVGARAARVLGLDGDDYLVSLVPPGPRLDWWGVYHLALGSSILAVHPREVAESGELVAEAFALAQATTVVVRLDDADQPDVLLGEAAVDLGSVTNVITVGPPPDPDRRAAIAEAWHRAGASSDLRVRAVWGPSEARGLWAECGEGTTGLHTYPDLEVLEVLDPITGEPTSSDGDLTITTAGWHGSALLRYRTGAWVDPLETDPCPACGRTVPRIVGEVVPEAWQPEVGIGDFVVRLDLRGVAAEVATTPEVRTWRTELREPRGSGTGDRLIVEIAGKVSVREEAALADRIEASCGVRPAEIRIVADAGAVDRSAAELGSVFADLR